MNTLHYCGLFGGDCGLRCNFSPLPNNSFYLEAAFFLFIYTLTRSLFHLPHLLPYPLIYHCNYCYYSTSVSFPHTHTHTLAFVGFSFPLYWSIYNGVVVREWMAEKTKLVFYFCTCLQRFFHTLIFITPLIFIFYIVLYLVFHYLALSFQYMCILLSSFSISLSWSSIWQKTRGLVSQKVQLSLSLSLRVPI